MPISAAQVSNDPFIRALSIVDERTGQRKLHAMRVDESEHSLVREFYRRRMDALELK